MVGLHSTPHRTKLVGNGPMEWLVAYSIVFFYLKPPSFRVVTHLDLTLYIANCPYSLKREGLAVKSYTTKLSVTTKNDKVCREN